MEELKFSLGMVRQSTDGEMECAYYFDHGGVSIWDPTWSECGRFMVEPEHYGLTKSEARALCLLNGIRQ